MAELVALQAHADRVAKRVREIDVRAVVLSLLVFPFLALGWTARKVVVCTVLVFGWVWYAVLEGWQTAAPKEQRT